MNNVYGINNLGDILAQAKLTLEFNKLMEDDPELFTEYIRTIDTSNKMADLSVRYHITDIMMSMHGMFSLEEKITICKSYSSLIAKILEMLGNHGISTEEDLKREYEKLKGGE